MPDLRLICVRIYVDEKRVRPSPPASNDRKRITLFHRLRSDFGIRHFVSVIGGYLRMFFRGPVSIVYRLKLQRLPDGPSKTAP